LPSCARLLVELQAVTDVRLNNTPLTIEAGRYIADVCPAANSVYTLVGTISDGQVITRTIQLAVLESTPTPPAELAAIPISTTAGCQTAMARLGTTRAPFCRFAPDGSRIAAPAADGSLWVIAVDGSAVAQVADFSGRFLVKGELVWSPDGESIAFSTTALDGSGSGVGVYQLSSAELIYFGPDARRSDTPESAAVNNAAWPRWTQDGRLLITWYVLGPDEPGVVSVLAPARYAPEGPAVLPGGTELVLSSGYRGQQVHPWKPGWVWRVGRSPSYEVAD
jgi:hypothetical protein